MQQLEQKIRQLVPSLQELSFGCEVRIIENSDWGHEVIKAYGDRTWWFDDSSMRFHPIFWRFDYIEYVQNKNSVEILGHPIQLHHVLQAIALTIGDEYAWEQAIDTTGQFRTDWGDKRHEGSGIYWDLTLPLSGQSEEVVKFLNGVLN